jgi:hypothetical protein
MEAYWGSGGIAPCILDFGTRWRRVVNFMPQPLYPQGKSPWYPLDRRLCGPQSHTKYLNFTVMIKTVFRGGRGTNMVTI